MRNIAAALVALRDLFGLSQKQLGAMLDLSQSALSKMESGLLECSTATAESIAVALGVGKSFFDQDFDRCPMSATAFRKYSDVTQTQAKSIRALGSILSERLRASLQLSKKLDGEAPKYLQLLRGAGDSISDTVQGVRDFWGVGQGPIPNLTKLVEALGICVIHTELPASRIDGLSLWPRDMPPVILLKGGIEGSRMRFTLAHELGHILLHSTLLVGKDEKVTEAEANKFASALLMPASIRRELPSSPDYWSFLALKSRWGTSALALIYRAKELGAITDQDHQKLYMYISRMGYRKTEQSPLTPERPELFQSYGQMGLAACENDLELFAARTFCTPRDAREWLDGGPISFPKPHRMAAETVTS